MSMILRNNLHPVSYGITHAGRVRDHNEDAFLEAASEGFWVVADGAGGHESGEIASQLIVKTLSGLKKRRLLGNFTRQILKNLHQVNAELVDLSGGKDTSRLIASTVSVLIIQRSRAICLWSGDSRIYLYRRGRLSRLTRDHNRIEEFIAAGFSRQDAENFPMAQHLTAAVGAAEELHTEIQTYEAYPDDMYLLCSDGLFKELSDAEIESIIKENGDAVERCGQTLMDQALANGGTDNITVLLVSV